VGAFAMAVHGLPRATGDIDIFIKANKENALRAYAALEAFGAPLHQLAAADLAESGTIFQIGIEPRRIDIINKIDGLSFDEARKGALLVTIDGIEVPVISRTDLIKNKLATGRERDRLDAESLKKI